MGEACLARGAPRPRVELAIGNRHEDGSGAGVGGGRGKNRGPRSPSSKPGISPCPPRGCLLSTYHEDPTRQLI